MGERYELSRDEKDVVENKIEILEVKPLPPPKYRVIPKNPVKVKKEVRPGIKIVEEADIERVEVEYV